MPAGSLLPVTIIDGKLYFLFGKENPMEDSSKGFSDFGGGAEDKSLYETALREAAEELTGFFGTSEDLRKLVKNNGGKYIIRHNAGTDKEYRVHIFYLEYDPHLVEHFNRNHRYLWERMDKKMLNESRLFEKIEIRWVCEDDLLKHPEMYRHFYVDIVKRIIGEKELIRNFIKICASANKPELCSNCARSITRNNKRGSRSHTRTISRKRTKRSAATAKKRQRGGQ